MSKKLGEILIEEGLIDKAQLDRALKAQLIFGGHVGTSLIELGYLDEDTLGRTLAEIHRLPYADRARLHSIPKEVLQAVSRRFVERHKVVPIALDRKQNTLELVVIETKSLGQLSSSTGCRIVPWIAPETCVLEAMERHYGVARRPRYISLERQQSVPDMQEGASRASVSLPAESRAEASVGVGDETTDVALATAADVGEEYGYGRSWREVAGEIFGDGSSDRETATPLAGDPAPGDGGDAARGQNDLAETALLLGRAETKDELARAVLDFVARRASRCILFAVQRETARVWDWRGPGLDADRVRSVRIPVTSGSLFTLLLGNSQYRGPIPDEPGCRWFHAALRMEPPVEVLLVPVYLQDRLVAILYGDGGRGGRVEGPVEEYVRLAEKLSLALNMLVLKMRIRAI